jgi:hypothetical protein
LKITRNFIRSSLSLDNLPRTRRHSSGNRTRTEL